MNLEQLKALCESVCGGRELFPSETKLEGYEWSQEECFVTLFKSGEAVSIKIESAIDSKTFESSLFVNFPEGRISKLCKLVSGRAEAKAAKIRNEKKMNKFVAPTKYVVVTEKKSWTM